MFFVSLNSALVIFFAAAFYIFCRPRWRWLYLFLLSCGMLLAASPSSFALACAQTAAAYGMGLWLGQKKRPAWALWLCIVAQLTPLLFYKAAGNWAIPLGLSYYTFQILSYLIEVHWQRIPAERRIGPFASYMLFFANKVAGPIERPALLAQMFSVQTPQGRDLFRSAMWIWLGLFQKFALADNLSDYVQPVMQFPENYSGLTATIAVLLSKYQIFCDFSGISLIALGLGGLFGLKLTPNFARPFASVSLREFWSRWHISLQTWIRDYVFFPLLSTRIARFGILPAMTVSFVVFGLWHDLRWTFVAYGVLQAVLVRFEPGAFARRLGRPAAVLFNYCVLISLPSVLFRARTFSEAFNVWKSIGYDPKNWEFFWDLGTFKLPALAGFIVVNEILQWAQFRFDLFGRMAALPWLVKTAMAVALLAALVLCSKFDPHSVFIYSQF
jgi:D-alanyl-lipoteichoic acid acyltransferase DltB (MBOAT superfamily)